MSLYHELKRRNVFRMAVLYVIAAWLIMQVAEVVITLAVLPNWTGQALLALLAVGFPIGRSQSLKLAYIRARTRKHTGSDTDTLALAWTMLR